MHYSGIEPCDILNGTGFRTVIWVSGCSIGCKGCFNPNTHNPNYGKEYTQEAQKYLLECLSKDYIDGITITGGNPLESYNLDTVLSLIKEVRLSYPEKTIWLYTGFRWSELTQYNDYHGTIPLSSYLRKDVYDLYNKRLNIIKNIDILVDGEYIDEQRDVTLKWRGSSNQRVIDVQQTLTQNKIVLYCD